MWTPPPTSLWIAETQLLPRCINRELDGRRVAKTPTAAQIGAQMLASHSECLTLSKIAPAFRFLIWTEFATSTYITQLSYLSVMVNVHGLIIGCLQCAQHCSKFFAFISHLIPIAAQWLDYCYYFLFEGETKSIEDELRTSPRANKLQGSVLNMGDVPMF